MTMKALALLKSVNADFTPFRLKEEQFLLRLLSESAATTCDDVQWSALSVLKPFLPYLHDWLPLPVNSSHQFSDLSHQCAAAFKRNLLINRLRTELIGRIADTLSQQGIRCVFMKGAAELVRANHSTAYRGRRSMDDIDLLCSPEALESADKALLSMGFEYSLEHFGKDNSVFAQRSAALEHAAQLIYRITIGGRSLEVELHRDVSSGRKRRNYPPDFARTLLESAESIDLEGRSVLVPPLEIMLVQMLAHAASATNHYFLVWQTNESFKPFIEKFVQDNDQIARIQLQIDLYQLDFLYKLKNLLQQFEGNIERTTVLRMLAEIKDRRILEIYLSLGQQFLPHFATFASGGHSKSLGEERRRLILTELVQQNDLTRGLKTRLSRVKTKLLPQ